MNRKPEYFRCTVAVWNLSCASVVIIFYFNFVQWWLVPSLYHTQTLVSLFGVTHFQDYIK